MPQKFPRTYNASNFNFSAVTSGVTTGKWNKVAYVEVPAQQQLAFGVGAIAGGVDFREDATINFRDEEDGQEHGLIRLAIANANETDIRVIKEDRTENFDDGVSLAETQLKAREDSLLIVYFKPDVSDELAPTPALGGTNAVFLIPVTVYQ